jgi:amidase
MRHLRLPELAQVPTSRPLPDVANLTVEEIRAGYDKGAFLPSDIIRACLARIAKLEPFLNAFIAINDKMLIDAERADAELSAGHRRGSLHGIPVIIKDNMNQTGFRTTAGYAGFASDDRIVDPATGVFNGIDLFPMEDATLVARLKEAGAIIIGKSNLPDFGLDGLRADSSYNGDTLNPYGDRFAPGASSTGSATGVSVGFGTVSLGTDTAGSILFPASAQSLVGLKPSFGLVPIDGVFPGLSSHHDVAGPIAKTVYDAAALLDIIAGPTAKDPRTLAAAEAGAFRAQGSYVTALRKGAFKGKRIGLYEPGQWATDLHPAVEDHYRRMVAVIQSLGAEPIATVFGDTDWKKRWEARTAFTQCNSYLAGVDAFLAGLGDTNPDSRAAFKARAGFDIGLGTTAPLHGLLADQRINVASSDPRLKSVMETAAELRQVYEDILAKKSIEALFVPRSVTPLPNIDGDTSQYLADQVVGTEINEMGLPVITLPAGFLPDGRPIAIDIVGRARFTEAELLALAFDFEQATLLRRPPPLD